MDRTQQVKMKNKISNPLPVTTGVLQESIVEPAIFLLYVNDIFTNNHPATLLL